MTQPDDPLGKSGLSDEDRAALTAKLSRIATETPVIEAGWRRLAAGTRDSVLCGLAQEIDTIVFPRRLVLRNVDGEELKIEAANRRLQRLGEPLPASIEDLATLLDGTLQSSDEEVFEDLETVFIAFAGASRHLWVQMQPLGATDAGTVQGLTAAAMAKAWAVDLAAPPPAGDPARIDRFLVALGDNCTDTLRHSDAAEGQVQVDLIAWASSTARWAAALGDAAQGTLLIVPRKDGTAQLAFAMGKMWGVAWTKDLSTAEIQACWAEAL